MKQKIITQHKLSVICLVSILCLLSACHSLTQKSALAFVEKNISYKFIGINYYMKEEGSDGSIGFAHYYGSSLGRFKDEDFYILDCGQSQQQLSNNCLPVPVFDCMLGHHKAGKCDGKWYAYTNYGVRVTNNCRNKYGKYIEQENKNQDSLYVRFYRLQQEATYKNGFLDGNFICYDINGNIIYKTKFTQGTGYYKHFYPLDGIQEEGAYLNGFKQGKWTKYHGLPERDTFVRFYNKGIEIK